MHKAAVATFGNGAPEREGQFYQHTYEPFGGRTLKRCLWGDRDTAVGASPAERGGAALAAGFGLAMMYTCPRLAVCAAARNASHGRYERPASELWARWSDCWQAGVGGGRQAAVLVSKNPTLDAMLLERMALGESTHHTLVMRHPFYGGARLRTLNKPWLRVPLKPEDVWSPTERAVISLTSWAVNWAWTLDALAGGDVDDSGALESLGSGAASFAVLRMEDMVSTARESIMRALSEWLRESCAPLREWTAASSVLALRTKAEKCGHGHTSRHLTHGGENVADESYAQARGLLEVHKTRIITLQDKDVRRMGEVAGNCTLDATCGRVLKALGPAMAHLGYSAAAPFISSPLGSKSLGMLFARSSHRDDAQDAELTAVRMALRASLRELLPLSRLQAFPAGWCAPSGFCAGSADDVMHAEVDLCKRA